MLWTALTTTVFEVIIVVIELGIVITNSLYGRHRLGVSNEDGYCGLQFIFAENCDTDNLVSPAQDPTKQLHH
jgi:hypothetical protein